MARTVLLADDSVTAQNMGRRILMDAGYEVITVNNGSAALKKIHENPPDLIVLDVYMPGYGGLEVCQRLKESGETMKIPVLLTVGKMEPFKPDEARRVRADAHIVKPFEAGELLAALTKLEDRIVPQSGTRKRAKPAEPKKARFWHVDEPDPAQAQADWSEKIAYLSEVKKRNEESGIPEQPSLEQPQTSIDSRQESVAEETTAITAETTPAAAEKIEIPETTIAQIESATPDLEHEEASEAVTFASASQPEAAESLHEASRDSAQEFEIQSAPEAVSEESVASESVSLIEPAIEPEAAPSAHSTNEIRWIAENIPVSAEEASLELDKEMQQAQAASTTLASEISEASVSESQQQVPTPVEEQLPPMQEEVPADTAFAAAASASAGVFAVSAEPSNVTENAAEGVRSEAAAAWQNWQQIRDSVMSPQGASALAASVAEIAQSSLPALTAPETAQVGAAGNSMHISGLDSSALASIVDNVLADLKPRLMEEIAKKLAADKK